MIRSEIPSKATGLDEPDEPRKRIGTAGDALDPAQRQTLSALERVFPVRFELAELADLNGFDGILALGQGALDDARTPLPRLLLPSDASANGTAMRPDVDARGAPGELTPVVLTKDPGLARPLRGRTIAEFAIAADPLPIPSGANMLALAQGEPVWWQAGDAPAALSISGYPLAGLREGEALRDHLRVGRFMGLLPLVRFIEQVLGAGGWELPAPRASFVIDDPNLHWTSYGFLDYRELAAHAAQHGYHVALATVPIDGWLADRRAAALLAGEGSPISLIMHGNDHVARELDRLDSDAQAQSVIAQALRRIVALERRSGVTVDRVMTPPHGACSEVALRAMFALGIEAISVAPTYPWRVGLPASTPLAMWEPAELVAGGLPVLPRYALDAPREELALRAMLGQPLILYGHHDDFAQGLDILAQTASDIDGLGRVRWGPLGSIARDSYATRRLGETLLVRMHARRITLQIPPGVRELRVMIPEPFGGAAGHRLTYATGELEVVFAAGMGTSQPLSVDGPTCMDLTLMADRPLDPAGVPAPGFTLWPWVRRGLAEGRDRAQTLRSQVGARGKR